MLHKLADDINSGHNVRSGGSPRGDTPVSHISREASSDAPIECRERFGGLLKYYHRKAA
jgi:hypothetical protein